jgi:NAD(P)-dependent dehydrogenase (short-subunit alcohol dehydrogenase family)
LSLFKPQVVGFTRALAARLRETDEKISVNAICPGLVDTPLISSTMKDNIPAAMKTPMSTIMRAFRDIIHDEANASGQVREASGPDVIPKDSPPYGNDATEYIVELRYRDLIDVGVLAKHGEERGKARKAMEVASA